MAGFQVWSQTFSQKICKVKPSDIWVLNLNTNPGSEVGWKTYTQHNAFGRFRCSWCRHSWASIHVVVLFRIQLSHVAYSRRGTVKMRVLGQRCSSCDRQSFEEPEIPMNVGNKILDNLIRHIQNVCYGEGNVPRPQDVHDGHEMHGPHLSSHCEACKMCICSFNKPSFISLQSSNYRVPDTPYISTETWIVMLCLFPVILIFCLCVWVYSSIQ